MSGRITPEVRAVTWWYKVDLAFVVLVLLAGACRSSQTSAPTPDPAAPATTALEFSPGRTLDVLGSDTARTDKPVVVVLRPSDHVELGRFLPALVAAGVLVFDAPWRPIEQGGRYPTIMEEVSCAVGYAREHAADHGGDPTTVTLAAHSAGTYIAALSSFRVYEGDCTSFPGLPDRMVGIAGIYAALTPEERAAQDDQIAELLGGPIEDNPNDYADLQLENHLGENRTLRVGLIHGAVDDVVPVDQTTRWQQHLDEAGYATEVHIVEGGDHTSLLLGPVQSVMVADWIRDFADPSGNG